MAPVLAPPFLNGSQHGGEIVRHGVDGVSWVFFGLEPHIARRSPCGVHAGGQCGGGFDQRRLNRQRWFSFSHIKFLIESEQLR